MSQIFPVLSTSKLVLSETFCSCFHAGLWKSLYQWSWLYATYGANKEFVDNVKRLHFLPSMYYNFLLLTWISGNSLLVLVQPCLQLFWVVIICLSLIYLCNKLYIIPHHSPPKTTPIYIAAERKCDYVLYGFINWFTVLLSFFWEQLVFKDIFVENFVEIEKYIHCVFYMHFEFFYRIFPIHHLIYFIALVINFSQASATFLNRKVFVSFGKFPLSYSSYQMTQNKSDK